MPVIIIWHWDFIMLIPQMLPAGRDAGKWWVVWWNGSQFVIMNLYIAENTLRYFQKKLGLPTGRFRTSETICFKKGKLELGKLTGDVEDILATAKQWLPERRKKSNEIYSWDKFFYMKQRCGSFTLPERKLIIIFSIIHIGKIEWKLWVKRRKKMKLSVSKLLDNWRWRKS